MIVDRPILTRLTMNTEKDYSDMTEEERSAFDKEARAREIAEQATLPFSWKQTLNDVDIIVPLKPLESGRSYRGKDIKVSMGKSSLFVAVVSNSSEPIIDGELFATIKLEDSTWLLDKNELHVHLEKINNMEWWKCVIKGHPEIDTTKIEPENSKLGDLDGATRAMVEKMMFDQRQKAMGKPTSEELNKQAMLEKFKAAHPEMDFSNAKINF